MLKPGYYAIYYHISAVMKRHSFIKLIPVFNDHVQNLYAGYAETEKKKEILEISRYFIVEICNVPDLTFVWHSSADMTKIDMALSIEKLCR